MLLSWLRLRHPPQSPLYPPGILLFLSPLPSLTQLAPQSTHVTAPVMTSRPTGSFALMRCEMRTSPNPTNHPAMTVAVCPVQPPGPGPAVDVSNSLRSIPHLLLEVALFYSKRGTVVVGRALTGELRASLSP